jgi:hypothetical protein
MTFSGNSTAADATFFVELGQVTFEGFDFNDTKSTAGNGVLIINGGSARGEFGGAVAFFGGTAGNATFIANSGTNAGGGGQIAFDADDESEAQIQLFGNATLTVYFYSSGKSEITVGSIEGDGAISLSTGRKLIIGNNDLNTTFSGMIEDFGSGSLGRPAPAHSL